MFISIISIAPNMIKNPQKLEQFLVKSAKKLGERCDKVFVAVSGGVDSSLVAAILCKAFGPKNVVGLYRNIKSNKQHEKDVKLLQKKLGFRLIVLDLNNIYDNLVAKIKQQFKKNKLNWIDENNIPADEAGFTPLEAARPNSSSAQAQTELLTGFTNAYASFKSRLTTPLAGFISKAIDRGHGRIFGTGNGEEDGLLRYFDKYGDGAVDNNILAGLTKAEVRQLARHMDVPERIIIKLPSADLEARGDAHNDESQLTQWAKNMGYNIKASYGAPDGSKEGNIAWAWKEDLKTGVITGKNSKLGRKELMEKYNDKEKVETILFVRDIEEATRHKIVPIPIIKRETLIRLKLVD